MITECISESSFQGAWGPAPASGYFHQLWKELTAIPPLAAECLTLPPISLRFKWHLPGILNCWRRSNYVSVLPAKVLFKLFIPMLQSLLSVTCRLSISIALSLTDWSSSPTDVVYRHKQSLAVTWSSCYFQFFGFFDLPFFLSFKFVVTCRCRCRRILFYFQFES